MTASATHQMAIITSQQALIGLNVYAAIIDEANFMGGGKRKIIPPMEKARQKRAAKPPMMVIAEGAMTQKEIEASLYEAAEALILRKIRISRQEVEDHLYTVCEEHYWAEFRRKRTVERVSARACRRNNVLTKRPRPALSRIVRRAQSRECPG